MSGNLAENLDKAYEAVGLEIRDRVMLRNGGAGLSDIDRSGAEALGTSFVSLLSIVQSRDPSEWSPSDRNFYVNLYTGQDGSDVEGFAYELIAWAAVVIGRLHHQGRVSPQLPVFLSAARHVPPLTRAGWYPNPPNFGDTSTGYAQFQRYWDGSQWTRRVRVRQGRGWREAEYSLHDPPNN